MARVKGKPVSEAGRLSRSLRYKVEYYRNGEWIEYDGVLYDRDHVKDIVKEVQLVTKARYKRMM